MGHENGATGPLSFMNPTTRRGREIPRRRDAVVDNKPSQDMLQDDDDSTNENSNKTAKKSPTSRKEDDFPASDIQQKWRSRDNRKGRHALVLARATAQQPRRYLTPPTSSSLRVVLAGVLRMCTACPYYDVSYLVAVTFVWGSVVWVLNAFFVWLPLQLPATGFAGEIAVVGGVTAFVGATVFEFGSVLLMLEAVNEDRSECFGWAVEEAAEEAGLWRVSPDLDGCRHHHQNKKNFVGKGRDIHQNESESGSSSNVQAKNKAVSKRSWTWWPTWHELTTHYLREIGFLACLAQFIGATIFWISGFTALPGINGSLSTPALNGVYWSPQVIGGTGFIVSGVLFMLETQQKWYLPAPKILGWHIGLWNLIGAVGFTLCGALGYDSVNESAIYDGSLATFWGSWAFLIGSLIQMYESLNKTPVEVEEGGGRIADTKPVA